MIMFELYQVMNIAFILWSNKNLIVVWDKIVIDKIRTFVKIMFTQIYLYSGFIFLSLNGYKKKITGPSLWNFLYTYLNIVNNF